MPWLQSPCFRQELLLRLPQNQADISGFHILFPSRVKPFEIRDENDDLKTSPKEHYYLPFSKANWARIVKHFHINRVIMDAMRENKCYTGFQNKRLQNDHMIRWFTGVTSPKNDPLSVSMSAVYFPQYRLSLAVVYNCDTMQLNLVKRLLRASPEASSHSLLMVGLFVEIQHHRISALMSDVTKELDQITTILNSKSSKFEYEENQKLRDALVAAKHCEEEARTARSQLEKIMKHATDHEKADHRGASAEYIQTTKRFKERFKQIYYQLEAISAESRVKAEELRTTSDLYLAQLARSEAREAASLAFSATRQAEISKYIALMAMFYLPLTAVSTIFATPVFKFENHWVDVNWKFRGGGAKDSNSPEPDLPVFSGRFSFATEHISSGNSKASGSPLPGFMVPQGHILVKNSQYN
ncbi:hypothetical protein QBC41DRAFT_374816 [Cercophora samala]|uniref:Uncharacterized protein n=1 Tax=Cercophora samala TaxID=330535 RepID=A0AA40D9W7_9PEZI|nr:hypothetical protein QBC41DRAFT_374816 [Cercophora samala]